MRTLITIAITVAGLALAACVSNHGSQLESVSALHGEEWVVEDIASRGVIDYARATMLFGPEGRLTGSTSCNGFFANYEVDELTLRIKNAGVTKRACAPAVMDQELRFLDVLNAVISYRIDGTGALQLVTAAGKTLTARRATGMAKKTTYRCPDNSLIDARYPTTDTAIIVYQGQSIEMTSAVSASGSRYVGDGWQWWTKGMTEGLLSPLADGESISSAVGMICTAQ